MDQFETVDIWLQSMELEQYSENFRNNGIVFIPEFNHLTEESLMHIGISSPGHRQKILLNLPTGKCLPDDSLYDVPRSTSVSHSVAANSDESDHNKTDNEPPLPCSLPQKSRSFNERLKNLDGNPVPKPHPRPRHSTVKEYKPTPAPRSRKMSPTIKIKEIDFTSTSSSTDHLVGDVIPEALVESTDFTAAKLNQPEIVNQPPTLPISYEDLKSLDPLFVDQSPKIKLTGETDVCISSEQTYDTLWPSQKMDKTRDPSSRISDTYSKPNKKCIAPPPDISLEVSPDIDRFSPPPFDPPPLPAVGPLEIETKPIQNDVHAPPPIPPRPPNMAFPEQEMIYSEVDEKNPQVPIRPAPLPPSDLPPLPPVRVDSKTPFSTDFPTPQQQMFDDPFRDNAEFVNDCDQFNSELQTKCGFSTDPVPDSNCSNNEANSEEPFDPFGLRQEPIGAESQPWNNAFMKSGGVHHLDSVVPAASKEWKLSDTSESFYILADGAQLCDESTDDDLMCPLDDVDCGSQELTSPSTTVPILPGLHSKQTSEISGYLYKQGGVNANKGLKKRWVVFDGVDLRYYESNKSQVSKRIIPVSCMEDVKQPEIIGAGESRCRFLLETKKRIFIFEADELASGIMWAQKLMLAIMKFKATAPPGGIPDGGVMHGPDKMGLVKFEKSRQKFLLVIKKDKLCYYESEEDYKMASPINMIDMKLASVKNEGSANKLKLSTHYGFFVLSFDNNREAQQWKMAMEEAIAEGLANDDVLKKVVENESNRYCADCNAPRPHWASINLGIVLCKKCAGIHREFEPSVSRIKSLRMDTKIWTPSLVELMKIIGNFNANQYWSYKNHDTITENTKDVDRKQYIHNKYKNKKYFRFHPLRDNVHNLNEELLDTAATPDILKTMHLVFSGADVLYTRPESDDTAFDMAKRNGQTIQLEFLRQNGGDRSYKVLCDEDECARLRFNLSLSGYLHKTGSNMKDFLKRWCVIENCVLSYYSGENRQTSKNDIDGKYIFTIQSVYNEQYPCSIELSTKVPKKEKRIYLFGADDEERRRKWLQNIAKMCCPSQIFKEMDDKEFQLAGYFYIKDNLASDWWRSWLMICGHNFYFTDKSVCLRMIDLRKVTGLKYLESQAGCDKCLEKGNHFVSSIIGNSDYRSLYIEADLINDTQLIFNYLDRVTKVGFGNTLEGQLLTAENVPVIIDKCITFISDNGFSVEGVYRKAGVESRIREKLEDFKKDARSVTLTYETVDDVHTVSNVLRRFLRQLDDSVFTKDLYNEWISKGSISNHNNKLQWLDHLLSELKKTCQVNYNTIQCLAVHLHEVSKHETENRMPSANIATIFGPTLMKVDSEEGKNHLNAQISVFQDIVQFYQWFFESEHDEEKKKQEKYESGIQRLIELKVKQATVEQQAILEPIHKFGKEENPGMQQIYPNTVAQDVIENSQCRHHELMNASWCLYEIIADGALERPMFPPEVVQGTLMERSRWDADYSRTCYFCIKNTEFMDRIIASYEPSRSLFGEMKINSSKKLFNLKMGQAFSKYYVEFKQSKLSYYKDSKSTHPIESWNIEDICIYKGADPKVTPPSGWCFTFIVKGENPSAKNHGVFGRTVCCNNEEELYRWLGGMMATQYPGFFQQVFSS